MSLKWYDILVYPAYKYGVPIETSMKATSSNEAYRKAKDHYGDIVFIEVVENEKSPHMAV